MQTVRPRPRKPYKAGVPGQPAKLSVSVSWEMKNTIDNACKLSGRTQGSEVEYRLNAHIEREQRLGGKQAIALFEALGAAGVAKFGPDWAFNPLAYHEMTEGDTGRAVMTRLRPVWREGVPLVSRPTGPDDHTRAQAIELIKSGQELINSGQELINSGLRLLKEGQAEKAIPQPSDF
jgi:hypothetical protein